MRLSRSTWLLLAAPLACASAEAAPVVSAPLSAPSSSLAIGNTVTIPAAPEGPLACGKPWRLGVVGGDARVLVVCANDVQRQPLDESSAIAQALSPGLDPARERVCSCVGRLRAPAFVDLTFTAKPDEGRVKVEAARDDDLDPELGPAFVDCVGTLVATFTPLSYDGCSGGKASFVYPVRVEL